MSNKPIITLAREVLDLAGRADLTPLKVNRHDTIAGAIGWQLQQDGGRAEVVGELIDLDIPKAKGTAYFLAAAHTSAVRLAEALLMVERELRVALEHAEGPDPEAPEDEPQVASALRRIIARLALDTPPVDAQETPIASPPPAPTSGAGVGLSKEDRGRLQQARNRYAGMQMLHGQDPVMRDDLRFLDHLLAAAPPVRTVTAAQTVAEALRDERVRAGTHWIECTTGEGAWTIDIEHGTIYGRPRGGLRRATMMRLDDLDAPCTIIPASIPTTEEGEA